MYAIAPHILTRPSLELKTLPTVCPVSISLAMNSTYSSFEESIQGAQAMNHFTVELGVFMSYSSKLGNAKANG
jgi:hypothetical protein